MEPIFPIVLIAPLQVCSSSLHTINIVLIAPLQSPWSSVTQGPFVLRVFNKGDHQSHLHQRVELLEEVVCAVCSAVVLPIALNTTLLLDVGGTEGEIEQVQS